MAKTKYDMTRNGNNRANIELRKKTGKHNNKQVIRFTGSVNIGGRDFVVSTNGNAKSWKSGDKSGTSMWVTLTEFNPNQSKPNGSL